MNTSPLVSYLFYRRGSSGVVAGSHRHFRRRVDLVVDRGVDLSLALVGVGGRVF